MRNFADCTPKWRSLYPSYLVAGVLDRFLASPGLEEVRYVLPRFKRDYKRARRNPELDRDTLEQVFDLLIAGGSLPAEFAEHRLTKRTINWAGFSECYLGAYLLMIYRTRRKSVVMHPIGTHRQLFETNRVGLARGRPR